MKAKGKKKPVKKIAKKRSTPARSSAAKRAPARGRGPKPTPSRPAPVASRGESATVAGVTIRPLRDRIVVKRVEETETRAGGIIVPDTAKEKPQHARVVATGPGRITDSGERVPLTIRRGESVLIGKWSGTEVKLGGEEYLILKEEEVLGIVG